MIITSGTCDCCNRATRVLHEQIDGHETQVCRSCLDDSFWRDENLCHEATEVRQLTDEEQRWRECSENDE